METNIVNNADGRYDFNNIVDHTYNLYDLMRLLHSVNKAICDSLGDYSQPTWDDISSSVMITSSSYQDHQGNVKSIYNSIEFIKSNPDCDAGAFHQNWCDFMQSRGWKYGPVKDSEKKEHPCLVQFKDLPQEQITKDAVFMTIVKFWLTVSNRV